MREKFTYPNSKQIDKGLEKPKLKEGKEGKEKLPNKIIVEVGVGGKPFFVDTERKIRKNEKYVGIDIPGYSVETPMLEKKTEASFKEIYENKNIQNKVQGEMQFLIASGDHLPFEGETVDEIVFKNVFSAPGDYLTGGEENEEKIKHDFINESARVLKKGGKIIIIENSGTAEYAKPFIHEIYEDQRFLRFFDWSAGLESDLDFYYPKIEDRQRARKSLEHEALPYFGHIPKDHPWYPEQSFVVVFKRVIPKKPSKNKR
ncbi:MAG: methyltransferase domain-containing protein [Candidatus Sungbacteria bacterium]|nr:methyltransferase domain-containing protein [Candidatus Sungbacteria bacterium]